MAKEPNAGQGTGGSPLESRNTSKPVKRRHKRARTKREEYVTYYVRVKSWDYYYSFRVSDPKSRWDTGPYSELATLTFFGEVILPKNFKYRQATVTLSAREDMMKEKTPLPPAASIGSITASGDELSAYMFTPVERMPELAAVAQSGRVQIICLTGTQLRYRGGSIRAVSLSTSDEEIRDEEPDVQPAA